MIRNLLTVKEVGARVGLGPWTLRKLEARGVIPPARRDTYSGFRVYSDDDVRSIQEALAALTTERTTAP